MRQQTRNYILCIMLLALCACERDTSGPVAKDNTPPGPLSGITVENLHGAARIGYTLPADQDLLYVKARYTTPEGEVRETKVSRYNRSLVVEGFGDTSTYTVTLSVVDQSENLSSSTDVQVRPLSPPAWQVRNSIEVAPDFGGINVKYTNTGEANLAIVVLANDSLGEFSPIETSYTNLKTGDFSARNMPAIPTRFGVYVRDRWNNRSDTMIVQLTPLFEALLDRTKMKGVILPTDEPFYAGNEIERLFDGSTTSGAYHSTETARMPQWFTYDMGVTAQISRLVWFMRPGYYYTLHNPKVVEIWGSANPNPNGSFDASWILLAKATQTKPSGLPEGQLSQADTEAALAGFTVKFPLNSPRVRYIRFKTLQNWSGGSYVNFYEIKMWGDTR
ncbi:DUF4959 domain-containing protein [Niabella pedocola]|uniref:DUF4959 domain-containing protein n=1 Tax=Niabella pedocola TaxID=1752077 RepID=A0ABS8PVJ1_9BACT|nr:DUF5000 domain-containing lipoprotein [Niabella pedocola]MCD2425086.1 DUF4959 domain-containing protein [Niabella pedocola]